MHHRGTEGTEQSYCKTDNHEAHEGHEEEQGKNPLDGLFQGGLGRIDSNTVRYIRSHRDLRALRGEIF